jgi:endoglucanase
MHRIKPLLLSLLLQVMAASPAFADIVYAGVNLSGAEFGMTHLPGTFGTDYTYPTTTEVDYYKSKGMNFIRLPFRWERLQHTNSASLDATELSRMNTFVSYATAHGVYVLLDPHNFMRYYPNPPGSFETATNGLVGSSVPNSDFSNFWFRVAAIYRTNSHVFFGLNNEPDTMPETQLVDSENSAIAAIRAAGAANLIFVPGNRWTGAWTWLQADGNGAANAVAMLGVVDPGSNYIFEVHQYLDSDGSGSHTTIVSADVGWERLTNFTAWARSNSFKGFLGEYAVPGAAIGGTNIGGPALTNMLTYIQTNSDVWLGWSYWGGGPWWGSSPLFPIEPTNIGQPTQMDQPVMDIIKQFFPLPVPTLQVVNRTQFQFNTAQGFVYQPQTSSSLAPGSWTSYGLSFPGTGGTTNLNMQNGTLSKAYYRVRVSHAP